MSVYEAFVLISVVVPLFSRSMFCLFSWAPDFLAAFPARTREREQKFIKFKLEKCKLLLAILPRSPLGICLLMSILLIRHVFHSGMRVSQGQEADPETEGRAMDGWPYGFIAKFTLRALTKFISPNRTKNRGRAQRHWQKQIRTHTQICTFRGYSNTVGFMQLGAVMMAKRYRIYWFLGIIWYSLPWWSWKTSSNTFMQKCQNTKLLDDYCQSYTFLKCIQIFQNVSGSYVCHVAADKYSKFVLNKLSTKLYTIHQPPESSFFAEMSFPFVSQGFIIRA